MTEPKMPELPEPLPSMKNWPAGAPWFSADQMRAYALQVAEEAIKICEEVAEAQTELAKMAEKQPDAPEYLFAPCYRHRASQSRQLARAIRARFTSPAHPSAENQR